MNSSRWIILKHLVQRDHHYDLLIEKNDICRTWKLMDLPLVDGPSVPIQLSTNHRLYWLEIYEGYISRDRGSVKRIDAGIYTDELPKDETAPVLVTLQGQKINARLEIASNLCRFFSVSQ